MLELPHEGMLDCMCDFRDSGPSFEMTSHVEPPQAPHLSNKPPNPLAYFSFLLGALGDDLQQRKVSFLHK